MSHTIPKGAAGLERSGTLPEDLTVNIRGSESVPAASTPGVDVGAFVGRYVVLDELGRGAMGRVVRAYDPKLQREVALKEVHGRGLGESGLVGLIAEARAMAKLSHPNVVGVYDVEERLDGTFVLVMEYVEGTDLRAWLCREERPWPEVLERFRQAGRGLAAAHAAGLLHLDFKPANVLVGQGGEVKVGDFGIAKVEAVAESSSMSSWDRLPINDLTHAGTVMGTLRYMAPEQHRAGELTPAADQYAFCVALWGGLCEAPPFGGAGGYEQLVAEKHRGPPSWPNGRVPRPIAAAILRGLEAEPSRRWPSMDALLDALNWDPGRRRRRWSMAAAGAIVVIGGMAGWHAWAESRVARCSGARARLEAGWGVARRAEVEAAILGVGASFAAETWTRTAASLDDYTARWVEQHTEACEATTIRGEQSAELLDLRMACLHRARTDLEAVTAELSRADTEVVRRAYRLTDGLPPLSRCDDVEGLRSEVEPPSAGEREALEAIETQLAELRARVAAGRYDPAKVTLDAVVAAAEPLDYGPIQTEVALAEGRVLQELGEYGASEAALRRALESGARWWQQDEMAEAAISLIGVIATWQRDSERALEYRELASGLVHGDLEAQASLAHNVASALRVAGDLPGAEAEQRRALELRIEVLGAEHPLVAESFNNLANTLADRGRLDDAEAMYQRALETWTAALGPEHPEVARALGSLGATLAKQGRFMESEAAQRRALEIREAALGPSTPTSGPL